VFVRDRATGTTELVSVSRGGGQPNDYSLEPSISTNGRFVAFASAASNVVAGDTNRLRDIFVRDRKTRTTTRVTVAQHLQ
jgi:Tol biopolymer transport system component